MNNHIYDSQQSYKTKGWSVPGGDFEYFNQIGKWERKKNWDVEAPQELETRTREVNVSVKRIILERNLSTAAWSL